MMLNTKRDYQKASSLLSLAEISFERPNLSDIQKYPSNSTKDYYDIIHNLLEAIVCLLGIKIKGENSHYELINFISSKLNLSEVDRLFLQGLREYRNKISYEGVFVSGDYLLRNREKIELIIYNLMNETKRQLNM